MPKLGDKSQMLTHKTGHFGFSAVKMDDLESSEYTLVCIVCDRSGSTNGFQNDMEAVLKEVLAACELSPRKHNLLVRVLSFDDRLEEIHGYKLLPMIQPSDYDGALRARGGTALYDATIDGVESLIAFGSQLIEEDYTVNGLLVVLTDGDENNSTLSVPGPGGLPDPKNVREAFSKVLRKECLESLLSILVGVNIQDSHMKDCLDRYHSDAGFTQFVPLADANKKTLAKLAAFVSKSISSQSQHLGTGGPSKPVTF